MTEEKILKDDNLESMNTASTGLSTDENDTENTQEAKQEVSSGEETQEADTQSKCQDKKRCKGGAEKQLAEENKRLNAKVSELTASLEKTEAELTETRDKYLRVLAEYDNFRKRSVKEREGVYTEAYSDALKEILPIIDNLELAAKYSEPDKLKEGLELIFKSAKNTLGKLDIEEFGAVGDKFDPQIHDAVMHSEDESAGENEIVEVFKKGYRKGDRIIRHAMVKVVN
jgi:molecular chaperone GrpE